MKYCNQDISKTITARSFKLAQLKADNERLPGENLKKIILFFLVIALCKFGHRKHDISKTITARSFKLAQHIEDKG